MLWGASVPGRALEGHPRQGKERPWAVGVVGLLPGPLLTPGHLSTALGPARQPLEETCLPSHCGCGAAGPPLSPGLSAVPRAPRLVLTPCCLSRARLRPQPCGASLACEPHSCLSFSHTWFCHPGSPRCCCPSVTPVTHLEANRWGALTSSLPVSGPSVSVGPVS